jgi:hypothetical protein
MTYKGYTITPVGIYYEIYDGEAYCGKADTPGEAETFIGNLERQKQLEKP